MPPQGSSQVPPQPTEARRFESSQFVISGVNNATHKFLLTSVPSVGITVGPAAFSLHHTRTSALQRGVNYASGAIKAKPGRTKFIGCHALISIQMRRQPTRSGSRTRMRTRTRTGTNSLTATSSQAVRQIPRTGCQRQLQLQLQLPGQWAGHGAE